MELKKCEKCGTYLIPYKTEDEGIIFLHPPKNDCKHDDVTKSVYLQLMVIDEQLFREHLKLFDKATYEKPHQYAEGIQHVIVNGELVVNNSIHTKAKPGRALTLGRDLSLN